MEIGGMLFGLVSPKDELATEIFKMLQLASSQCSSSLYIAHIVIGRAS
jgi:hypothetical protein